MEKINRQVKECYSVLQSRLKGKAVKPDENNEAYALGRRRGKEGRKEMRRNAVFVPPLHP